jgi:hypothetical protein
MLVSAPRGFFSPRWSLGMYLANPWMSKEVCLAGLTGETLHYPSDVRAPSLCLWTDGEKVAISTFSTL